MSDYTPTTEEVRNTFWLGQHSVSETDWANSEADFNKWLAEVKAQAIAEFFTDNGLSYRARALKEKAWQEGHDVGIGDALFEPIDYTANPYRQGEPSE